MFEAGLNGLSALSNTSGVPLWLVTATPINPDLAPDFLIWSRTSSSRVLPPAAATGTHIEETMKNKLTKTARRFMGWESKGMWLPVQGLRSAPTPTAANLYVYLPPIEQ